MNKLKVHRNIIKHALNIWSPYLGAGIKIEYIRKDWKEMKVSMKLRFYNRNIMNTHFGGSLYSMVDPHIMLMLMQLLGEDYIVWDKSAEIDFIKPGKGKVHAVMRISDDVLSEIKEKTANGEKYLPKFNINIYDENNNIVSKVTKTLYIRKKKVFK